MAFNMATLLEEDEVTLMLAQHHVSEARQLLAKARCCRYGSNTINLAHHTDPSN
jgi:hypothetical protein